MTSLLPESAHGCANVLHIQPALGGARGLGCLFHDFGDISSCVAAAAAAVVDAKEDLDSNKIYFSWSKIWCQGDPEVLFYVIFPPGLFFLLLLFNPLKTDLESAPLSWLSKN